MFTIDNILHSMRARAVLSHIAVLPAHEFKGVRIYERGMKLSPEMVYAARAEDLMSAGDDVGGNCFVVSGGAGTDISRLPADTTVLVLDCSLTTICNNLIWLWQRCQRLRERYRELVASQRETALPALVEAASEELDTTVLILSSGFSLLAGRYRDGDEMPLLQSLRDTGSLDADGARRFVEELCYLSDSCKYSEYAFSLGGSRCLVCHLRVHNYTAAHILVVLQNNEEVNYYLGEVEELSSYALEVLNRYSGSFTLNGPFNDLVIDVLERRLTGRDTISARLAELPPRAYGSAFSLITMSFENTPQDFRWHYISNQVLDILPASNVSVYNNDLLIFTRYEYESGAGYWEFDRDLLNALMLEHNAYAAIGASTKYLSALPTMYHQCSSTIRLAKRLSSNPNQRIFNYEDYSVYMIIEMCTSDHFRDFHQGRYYFLCHQDVLRLARYDRKNNTDYLDVLYTYLANNCKITQTSRELYMHRNTIISKIEKIEQIIGESLDNSFLQERLLFSYHLIEYIEKYLGEDIFPQSFMD